MFSGVVEEIGTIIDIIKGNVNSELVIGTKKLARKIKYGNNISVNGVNSVIVRHHRKTITVSMMTEIIRKSNLKYLVKDSTVNLEKSIKLDQMINHHIVIGHVDAIGVIKSINIINKITYIWVQTYDKILKSIMKNGFITIDGLGLLVTDINKNVFEVKLNSLSTNNTLQSKKVGDIVNIEIDILKKYIEQSISKRHVLNLDDRDYTALNMDFLRLNGFL